MRKCVAATVTDFLLFLALIENRIENRQKFVENKQMFGVHNDSGN